MSKKFFPINTETACPLKWSWSTLLLSAGKTASCHRTAFSDITADTFSSFHNTAEKIADRESMLAGKWPESNCSYCRNIEASGGFSDRNVHALIPDMYPESLDHKITTNVSPTIVEVYFENVCNLACVYCRPEFSSRINAEYQQFGKFVNHGVSLDPIADIQADLLIAEFWKWLAANVHSIKRLQVLGGEPLVQKHAVDLLEFLEVNPAPHLELNIVTNLAISIDRLIDFVQRVKKLVASRKIKRFDVTASIDCMGPAQEYVRYGLNINKWIENFQYLVDQKWVTVNINQTVSVLTIKTMAELVSMITNWKKQRPIGHYFGGVYPDPLYLQHTILGSGVFDQEFETILSSMSRITDSDKTAYNCMEGLYKESASSTFSKERVRDLFIFLDEVDRRRGTSWQTVFPWLMEFKERVV